MTSVGDESPGGGSGGGALPTVVLPFGAGGGGEIGVTVLLLLIGRVSGFFSGVGGGLLARFASSSRSISWMRRSTSPRLGAFGKRRT